jgi:hypothetical protein
MSVDQISGPKKDLSLLLRLAKAGEIYLQHPKEKQMIGTILDTLIAVILLGGADSVSATALPLPPPPPPTMQ